MGKRLVQIGMGLVIVLVGIVGYHILSKRLPNEKKYIAKEREQQWINDITYLEEALPKVHPNLFFKQSEDYFIEALEALKEKVSLYTDEEINLEMSQIVASMGDSHTGVNIGVETKYPIALYWYDEGIYIVDTSKDYQDILYSRMISLNDKPIEEVANSLRCFFGGANEQWFKNQVMYYINSNAILKYVGAIEEDEIQLKVEKADGTIQEIKMLPEENGNIQLIENESIYKIPFYKTHPYENYWYEYLPEEKIMYVNYSSASEMLDKPFEIFTDEVFNAIETQEVERLVLDLRLNQGGSDLVFRPFLKRLKKSTLNAEDKLYVVMGRKTYSAGLNTVINIQKATHATIIGEASGGRPNHYGDVKVFSLPNSQIKVRCSTKFLNKINEDMEALEPDVAIGVSAELEREGRDSVLEWLQQ